MSHQMNHPLSGKRDKLGTGDRLKTSAESKLRLARLKLDDDHDRILEAIVKGSPLDHVLQTYRKNMIATGEMLGLYLQGEYSRVCEKARGWV
jgi:hypothetical protein